MAPAQAWWTKSRSSHASCLAMVSPPLNGGRARGTAFPPWRLRRLPFVEQHPGRAELVPEHGKARREKGLLHLHKDLTAVRKERVETFRFLGAVDSEGQIGAPHELGPGNVGSHEHRLANRDTSVEDGLLPIGRYVGLIRLL